MDNKNKTFNFRKWIINYNWYLTVFVSSIFPKLPLRILWTHYALFLEVRYPLWNPICCRLEFWVLRWEVGKVSCLMICLRSQFIRIPNISINSSYPSLRLCFELNPSINFSRQNTSVNLWSRRQPFSGHLQADTIKDLCRLKSKVLVNWRLVSAI